MLLEVAQAIEAVLAGKTWNQLVLVLVIAALDVIGDPNLQGPGTPAHHIDPVVLHPDGFEQIASR